MTRIKTLTLPLVGLRSKTPLTVLYRQKRGQMCRVFQGTVNSYQGARQYCSADFQSAVSRISNPQKVVFVRTSSRLEAGDTAGWKPALQDSTAIAPHSEFEPP